MMMKTTRAARLSFRGCNCCAPARLAPQRRRLITRPVASGSSPPGGLSAAAAAGSAGSASPQGGRSAGTVAGLHRIDIHHHVAPPRYVEETRALQQPPMLAWSPQRSIDDMDQAGVATAITSITTPGIWLGDDAQGRHLARICNDYAAELIRDFPSRFGMFAALPLPDTDGSLHEIEYGLDVLKADGVCLFTSYRDKWLGDPAFEPVMDELNRRKAVVYTHPEAPVCCRGLIPGINESVIEYGTDTTRAIARLLFSGTAHRYPDIRWIFSHGGGTLPMLVERFVRAGLMPQNRPHVPDGVMTELLRFHYDVAQIAHPSGLSALTRMVPISRILWGTDFPFRLGPEYLKPLSDFFGTADLQQIERDNALTLLPKWR
jgi:predicted TIM-barrel fold metal-dependent hydrolase